MYNRNQLSTPGDKTPVTTTATTYEEKPSKPVDFISENTESKGTNEPATPTTSIKYAEDFISTREVTLMTTETLETECTTEIELQTPEDKTPVTTTASTHEEKPSKPVDFISENTESKGTNEPATPTTSIKYAEDLISTRQVTLLTTETLETECTTEIELRTPEDKTPVTTTASTHEEKPSKPVDFISENTESKGTNEPATPTTSIKYAEDFISTTQETLLTKETLETECPTEINLSTPGDKTPVTITATTYEEKTSKPVDFISENIKSKGTNEPATPTTSIKYAEDFISTREVTLLTTETLETECTTEIYLQTPEDKTPVTTTATTYEEKPSKPVDFISENTESKGTNEPATPTTSIKYAEDFISTTQETLLTTETLETECTTEIELNTPEDKTPVTTTATTYEEKPSKPVDFISENTESKGTNEPATPTTSIKYAEDFNSTRQVTLLTTETLGTECTTEIELQTPEDKTPVTTTASTHEEKPSKPVDFISENTESKGTNEPATPTTSIKYAEDLISTRQVTLLTTETLETECTTEIELQTPEDKTPVTTTATTYEEKPSKPVDFISEKTESKGTNEPATPTNSIKYAEDFISTTQETLLTTETIETECTTEINLSTPGDKTPVTTTASTHEEKTSKPVDFISENTESKGTNEPATPTTSIKYAEDFISTTQETLLTKETLETECTTEINLSTPGDKTPVTTTATTYEEKPSKPVDFISENIKSKGTNEPATPKTSIKYAEDFISTREVTLLTTETLETECTTEIYLQTPENKTPVTTTATTYEENPSKPVDFISENTESKGTNEPATPTTSIKYAEDLISTRQVTLLTTETLETECTTEIELQTPEDKTPVTTTASTHEEKPSKPVDFISENTESKGTNEPATPTTSIKYAEDFISTTHETLLTKETLETECTTEINLSTPGDKTPVTTTATTYEEKPSKPVDFISENIKSKGTNEPAAPTTSIKYAEDFISTREVTLMTTETLETECTTEIYLQTPEDKTPVTTTASTHEEKPSKPVDFISENTESKGTNEPATPTTSIKYAEDFISTTQETLLTKETLETECTTEINLSTPGDKTPVTTTATTYEEKPSKPVDFISENTESKGTNEPATPRTSIKYAEGFISTREVTLLTTETLETECTTEIYLQTPEDKTPVTTTATTYEEKPSKPVDFISENTESKGTNEPATPTTSIKYAEDFISTTQETLLTTETLETECTTEINLSTTGDKTPVTTTATTYEEKPSKPVDFISENTESKGTNEPATPTTSIKYAEDFISTRQVTLMTTETLETECTTEIELQTPEDKTPVTTTASTHEEKPSKPVDFISENTESKGTNEPATPTTSIKYAEDFISTTQETLLTKETLETECTTEIELQTPEDKTPVTTTATTYEEKQSEERKEIKPTMAVPGVETQTPPSKETEALSHTDEDGCFGLIHRTSSGLKRCQEKI